MSYRRSINRSSQRILQQSRNQPQHCGRGSRGRVVIVWLELSLRLLFCFSCLPHAHLRTIFYYNILYITQHRKQGERKLSHLPKMKFLSCSLTLVVAVAALSSNGACAGRNNRRRHKGAGTSTGNNKTQATTTTTAAKSTFKCQLLGRGCYNDRDCCQNGNVGVVCSYKWRAATRGTCAAPTTTTTTTTAAPFAFTTSSAPGLSQQELQSYLDIYEKSARETEMEISRLKEYIDGMTGSDSEFTRTTERPYRRLRALQLTSTGARNASNPIRATLIKPLTMTDRT